MVNTQIGHVIHYFDKIQVAVVKLSKGDLKIGDDIKLEDRNEKEFQQKVSSMQIEHASIDIAKAGDEFGLKVERAVKPRTKIYKV